MEAASFENHDKLRELHEEEERMKLRILQADAGLIGGKDLLVTAERMDWMYHNPAQAKKENEEYLLGKVIETPDEREEMRKRLGAGTTAAGSLFLSSITSQNDDTLRRLREDPLLIIRQAEHRQRCLEATRQRLLDAVKIPVTENSTSAHDRSAQNVDDVDAFTTKKSHNNSSCRSSLKPYPDQQYHKKREPSTSFPATRRQNVPLARRSSIRSDRHSRRSTRSPRLYSAETYRSSADSRLGLSSRKRRSEFRKDHFSTTSDASSSSSRHSYNKRRKTFSNQRTQSKAPFRRENVPKERNYSDQEYDKKRISTSRGRERLKRSLSSEFKYRAYGNGCKTSLRCGFSTSQRRAFGDSDYPRRVSNNVTSFVTQRFRSSTSPRQHFSKRSSSRRNERSSEENQHASRMGQSSKKRVAKRSPSPRVSYKTNKEGHRFQPSSSQDTFFQKKHAALRRRHLGSISSGSQSRTFSRHRSYRDSGSRRNPRTTVSPSPARRRRKGTRQRSSCSESCASWSRSPSVSAERLRNVSSSALASDGAAPSAPAGTHTLTEGAAKIVKGPVRPLEWQSYNPPQRDAGKKSFCEQDEQGVSASENDSDTSSDSVGPPSCMAASLDVLRNKKACVPLLWKSRTRLQQGGSTSAKNNSLDTRAPSPSISDANKTMSSQQTFSEVQKKNDLTQASQLAELERMVEEGRRHQRERTSKLAAIEHMEHLQEVIEDKKRSLVSTASSSAKFVTQVNKEAYLDDSITLEERLKRYAARRQKTLLERNELDDETL